MSKKYPPSLNKRRKQPDYPGLLHEDIDGEMEKIDKESLRQDMYGLLDLMKHYHEQLQPMADFMVQAGFNAGQAQYMALSLCLAKDHVPAFKTAAKRGRKSLSEENQALIIKEVTAIMVEKNCSAHEAACIKDEVKYPDASPTYDQWRNIKKGGHFTVFSLMLMMLEKDDITAKQLHDFVSSERTIDDLPLLTASWRQDNGN